jgi:hypothetical protein
VRGTISRFRSIATRSRGSLKAQSSPLASDARAHREISRSVEWSRSKAPNYGRKVPDGEGGERNSPARTRAITCRCWSSIARLSMFSSEWGESSESCPQEPTVL